MVSPSSSATPPCAPAATPGPSLPVPGMPHAEDAWYSWLNSPDGTAIQVMMRVYEKTLTKREVSLNTLDPQFISCHIQGEELPRLNVNLHYPAVGGREREKGDEKEKSIANFYPPLFL